MLKASIQRLVVHAAAHFARDAAPVWDIIPDAHGIVVMIESVGHRVEKLLGLFSPFPIHLLQPRVYIQPAIARQPERGTIRAGDVFRFLLAPIAFSFQLINALVQGFQEKGIVDFRRFAIGVDRIHEILVIGIESHDLLERLAIWQCPLDGENDRVELAFFDNPALANVLVIDPMGPLWGSSY